MVFQTKCEHSLNASLIYSKDFFRCFFISGFDFVSIVIIGCDGQRIFCLGCLCGRIFGVCRLCTVFCCRLVVFLDGLGVCSLCGINSRSCRYGHCRCHYHCHDSCGYILVFHFISSLFACFIFCCLWVTEKMGLHKICTEHFVRKLPLTYCQAGFLTYRLRKNSAK